MSETRVRIGITEYAQSKLGDIVFVQLPDVGSETESGESFGEVESPKSVSDLYAPLTGKVVEVNGTLEASPELVNTDPYGEGWIVILEIADVEALEAPLEQTLDSDGDAKITDGWGPTPPPRPPRDAIRPRIDSSGCEPRARARTRR